jgi:hypothetical protein
MRSMSIAEAMLAARSGRHVALPVNPQMTPQTAASSAQRARAIKQRLRRAHEHRVHILTAAALSSVLAVVLASGFYFGFISFPSHPKPPDLPAPGSFEATRTGHLTIPAEDGWCRIRDFDNKTAQFGNTRLVNCDNLNLGEPGAEPNRAGGYGSFADSFRKR